jgi:hypothetical protein
LEINNKWFLRGVISNGVEKNVVINEKPTPTCNPIYPSLFVDLANSMDWIVKEVANEEKNKR